MLLFITNEIGSVLEAKRLLKLYDEYMINGFFSKAMFYIFKVEQIL